MSKCIYHYFSIGSPWAYLGLQPLKALSLEYDIQIVPVVSNVISENGGIFLKDRPAHRRAYWLADLKRWADFRGLPLALEDRHALGNPLSAAYMVIAAILDGQDWHTLTQALQQALWEHKRDIGLADVRIAVANEAGFDGQRLNRRESDSDVLQEWEKNLQSATALGVFGSPTYVYESELFWGQDSLFLLERKLKSERLRLDASDAAPQTREV